MSAVRFYPVEAQEIDLSGREETHLNSDAAPPQIVFGTLRDSIHSQVTEV